MADRDSILRRYDEAVDRIENFHIRAIGDNPSPVMLISTHYPGVYMEHAFDGICYGRLFGGEKAYLDADDDSSDDSPGW